MIDTRTDATTYLRKAALTGCMRRAWGSTTSCGCARKSTRGELDNLVEASQPRRGFYSGGQPF